MIYDAEREVFEAASSWLSSGFNVWLYTVVRTWGSSPRPIGSVMALRDDGRVVGSVSGGCVEDDLIDQLQTKGPPSEAKPSIVEYGLNADEAHRFGLPCGGTLQLVQERLGSKSGLDALLCALRGGQIVRRTLRLSTGEAYVADASDEPGAIRFDKTTLSTVHGPTWRMLLIGGGNLSAYVSMMAIPLGYAVTLCDPRPEYAAELEIPGVKVVRTMPDDAVIEMKLDARSAVVALTHDPKLDDLALIEALETRAFYVGAIGSRRNSDARRERLSLFGLRDVALANLRCPVGLYLGGNSPPEIALSIVADVTARRNGIPITELADVRLGKAIAG
ncbi:xanthine dehydrogenase accessory factor [Burkholderia sp. GAS332]|nr:xanthine dehydrogenase accessory factor [Burkholderia sp. GAS332]